MSLPMRFVGVWCSAWGWRSVRSRRWSPAVSLGSTGQCGLVWSSRWSRKWVLRLYWSGPGSPSPAGAALRLTYWANRPAETLAERGATFWAGCTAPGPAPAM